MPKLDVVQFITRSDNFAVLLHDAESGRTAAIDAPEAEPIKAELDRRGWKLSTIYVTHKHLDHIEGIPPLQAAFDCEVIGPAKSAEETGIYDRSMDDGDVLDFAGHPIRVFATPGHTLDHLSLHFPDDAIVFVGDTVFSLGCGRVIEGDHAMMWESVKAIRALPDATQLYCGHEYTQANAKFALAIDGANAALKARAAEVDALRAENKPALPTTIGREKATNPFLRADDPALMKALGMASAKPAEVFAEIRTRKDKF